MPIDCIHADQFSGFFKSASGGLIAGGPEHGVPLNQLLGAQLASFSGQVDIRGTEVVLHARGISGNPELISFRAD